MSDVADQPLAHIVFFTLEDGSAEARRKFVNACQTSLSHEPGIQYFAVGERGEEFQRAVNEQQYHVGLHVVFESRAAHDAYQEAPKHLQFIAENKGKWQNVQIFDTYLA